MDHRITLLFLLIRKDKLLFQLEMCMGIGFPMGPGIPWESHGNGNKTQNWEWEWEGMGNHLTGNGNYLHSHGNLFPKFYIYNFVSPIW